MTDLAAHMPVGTPAASRPKLDGPNNIVSIIAFFGIVGAALLFIAYSLYVDVDDQWYRAWTIGGRWEFVAANDLPRDIATEIER